MLWSVKNKCTSFILFSIFLYSDRLVGTLFMKSLVNWWTGKTAWKSMITSLINSNWQLRMHVWRDMNGTAKQKRAWWVNLQRDSFSSNCHKQYGMLTNFCFCRKLPKVDYTMSVLKLSSYFKCLIVRTWSILAANQRGLLLSMLEHTHYWVGLCAQWLLHSQLFMSRTVFFSKTPLGFVTPCNFYFCPKLMLSLKCNGECIKATDGDPPPPKKRELFLENQKRDSVWDPKSNNLKSAKATLL